MSGAAVGASECSTAEFPAARWRRYRERSNRIAGNTVAALLTHFIGSGLTNERYAVGKFRVMAGGNVRRCPDQTPKGRRELQGEDRRRHAEGDQEDAALPQRDHRVHRSQEPRRGPVLWKRIEPPVLRPSPRGLRQPSRMSRRPDVPDWGAGAGGGASSVRFLIGKENAVMAYRDVEARRAQNLARWHRRAAKRRARQVHQVWIKAAGQTGRGSPTFRQQPSIRRRRMDPHPAAA